MKYVIPATAYRRLTLLNKLFFATSPLSKKDLLVSIMTSMNTLNSDIAHLNEIFPEDMSHIVEKDRLVSLQVAEDINFDYLTAYMICTSDLFQLSLSTFQNTSLNVPEWAEEHFISLASLYLKLKEVDTFLAQSRLILNTEPLQIQGNEISVRFFYFHLFSKAYPYSGWVIDGIDVTHIHTFISKLEKNSRIYFSVSSRLEYAIAIGVSLSRAKQGFSIKFDEEDQAHWEEMNNFYSIDTVDFSDLDICLGKTLTIGEQYIVLKIFFLTSFTYIQHKEIETRIRFEKELRPQRFKLAMELIAILDGSNIDRDVALVGIIDYLARYAFVDKIHLILDVDYFSTKYSPNKVAVADIEAVLSKYEVKPGYKYIRDNKSIILKYLHDLFNITLLNAVYTKRLHVKIISKNGFLWEEYMKMEIRKYYSEELVVFCEELQPAEHWRQYDLIISDFPIESPNDSPILVWHMPPAKRDLEQLQKIIVRKSHYTL
ncbi:helix-turn-helix domain-containing protein [Listeria rocourtiae]|uniref:helix-turn-helix domain-containing protein n=1 Tax=Listeria rocourtiae TaxID=647910 RepID=UPI003D2F6CD4